MHLSLPHTHTQIHTHAHTHADRDAHTFLMQRVERSVMEAEHWTDACSTPTCSGTRSYRRMLCWHERLMCPETKTADRWLINPPHCRVHCRQPDMPASQLINFWCSQTRWRLLCSPCDTCQMNAEEENCNISSKIVLTYYASSCAPLTSCCCRCLTRVIFTSPKAGLSHVQGVNHAVICKPTKGWH